MEDRKLRVEEKLTIKIGKEDWDFVSIPSHKIYKFLLNISLGIMIFGFKRIGIFVS